MTQTCRAIEVQGTMSNGRSIVLDESLPDLRSQRVKVIILFDGDVEIDEQTWLRAASANAVFDYLNDPAEDLYTLADGRPFHDKT
jgi:hypothetical protein